MLSEIVANIFAEKPDKVLFHYTSYSGLSGIAGSKTLRLSEIRHLNDAQELSDLKRWLQEEINDRVREFVDNTDINALIRERSDRTTDFINLRTFEGWMHLKLGNEALALFVGSFTEKGNLLSQWRGYCPFGKGVSIGFNPTKVLRCAERSSMLLGRCIYDPETKRDLAKKIMDEVIDFCRHKGPIPIDQNPFSEPHFFSEIEPDLLTLASLVKHEDFREEAEWRIVLPARKIDEAPITGYREGKSAFVPYVEFDLPITDSDKLLLEQIFLGPTSNEDLAFRSLKLFARDNTACHNVYCSRSSYRET